MKRILSVGAINSDGVSYTTHTVIETLLRGAGGISAEREVPAEVWRVK